MHCCESLGVTAHGVANLFLVGDGKGAVSLGIYRFMTPGSGITLKIRCVHMDVPGAPRPQTYPTDVLLPRVVLVPGSSALSGHGLLIFDFMSTLCSFLSFGPFSRDCQ